MCIRQLAHSQILKALSFIIFLFLYIGQVKAQLAEDIVFKNISMEQGLSNKQVKAILQGSNGYIWIATMDGLNRFDGYDFKYYRFEQNDSSSLRSNNVWALHEDRLNNLWVGTSGGYHKLNRQTDRFTRILNDKNDPTSISNNTIFSIGEDATGNLWAGSYFKGLNLYNRETKGFMRFRHNTEDTLSLSDDRVFCIFVDSHDVLWVGTKNGLNKFDKATQKFKRYFHNSKDPATLSGSHIYSIAEDKEGELWVGTYSKGLNRFDRSSNSFIHYKHDKNEPGSISDNRIRKVFKDSKGDLWIGTSRGLNKYIPQTNSFIKYLHSEDNPNSLISDLVKEIAEDANGNLWIGTYLGISLIPSKKMQIKQKLPEKKNTNFIKRNWIWAISEGPAGNLWVGSWDGLYHYNRSKEQKNYFSADNNDPGALSYQSILSLHIDEQGIVWIGTYTGGLNRYDPSTNSFRHFKNNPNDPHSISSNIVRSILEDRVGNLWIGTSKGLNRMDKKTGRFTRHYALEEHIDSLQNDYIWSLCEDINGIIWMGTSGDVHKYDPTTKKFSIFDQYPGYQKVSVHHITKDLEGNLLFVGNGMSYLEMETGRLKQFNMSNGVLNSDDCSCALIDNNGDIWAADGKGILKINTNTGESRRFDMTDGLQDWTFNNSSCYKGSDGTLYFGGNKGFNSFHPDSVNVSGYMPPVSLTNFQLFNEDIPLIHEVSDSASSELIYKLPKTIQSMEQLTLPYNAFVMSFEYASMDFASAEKNEYQYMLENFDGDWNKVGSQRKATYTNISPGAYVFRVKGTNNDGVWSDREVALPITILPPWWLTWWMKSIYWILGIGGPLAFYFTRVSVLKKQKAKLELQVLERTREVVEQKEEIETQAEELQASNDQLVALDGFKEAMTGMVVHDFKNSLNTIINFSDEVTGNPKMLSIRQAGKNMYRLVMNLLDVQKFEDAKVPLSLKDQLIYEFILTALDQVKFLLEQKNLKILMDLKDNLSGRIDEGLMIRVLENLLTNAIKFSPVNADIRIVACAENQNIKISISDKGSGISTEHLERVFNKFEQIESKGSGITRSTGLGLTFCKLVIEAHDGSIGVVSEIDQGSTFWFTLPRSDDQELDSKIKAEIGSLAVDAITLTKEEQSFLRPIQKELRQLNIYEYSRINGILSQIEKGAHPNIDKWREHFEIVLRNMDEERYNKMLNS